MMPSYNLTVLGLDIFFRTEADEERVQKAMACLEERFGELNARGLKVGKEKLLTFLALSLADDLLQCEQRLCSLESRLAKLVDTLDDATVEG